MNRASTILAARAAALVTGAVLAVSTVSGLVVTSTASAAPTPAAPASIKVVFTADAGQKIFEVTDKAVGTGPELTPADRTQDLPGYGGDATVDIDPDQQSVTISAGAAGFYWQGISLRLRDLDLTRLTVVSDAFSQNSKAQVTGQPGDWTVTWDTPYAITGTSTVFSYAPAIRPSTTPSPTPTPSAAPARDTVAPDTRILTINTARAVGKRGKIRATFTADESPATYRCAIDDRRPVPCGSTYGGEYGEKVKPGRHTFTVVATDAAGNVDPTPATATVTVKKART